MNTERSEVQWQKQSLHYKKQLQNQLPGKKAHLQVI